MQTTVDKLIAMAKDAAELAPCEFSIDQLESPRWGDKMGWAGYVNDDIAAIWSELPIEAKLVEVIASCYGCARDYGDPCE